MANRTIARLFSSYSDATAAVRDLEAAGISHDDISLVAHGAKDDGTATPATGETGTATGTGTGATLGTLVGGGAGLLAGIGALAIPGLGPIVAAGWLVAALTGAGVGAAAGGLLGALTQAGIGEEQAGVYAEGVRRGGNLVTVRVDDSRAAEVETVLAKHNGEEHDVATGRWDEAGWTRTSAADPAIGMGTAAGLGTTAGFGTTPDGAPGNPPGTQASRGFDRVAGTNVSGAHPQNETATRTGAPDGTPGNPPGTKLSRGFDEAAGTNVSGAHPENEVKRDRNPIR
ncbi:MAG: hypothetical protein JWP04_1930 [Belnapia sp.]|nr:hypothetical protein [Belnapia sp.]